MLSDAERDVLNGVLGVLRDGRQHPVQTGGALRNRAAIF